MRAVGWQGDQIYATVGSGEESAYIRSPVVGSIVPDDVDLRFVGISCFYLSQKLYGACPIHGARLDERRIEIFQVQCPVDINAPPSRSGLDGGLRATPDPAEGRLALVLGMHRICKINRLISL